MSSSEIAMHRLENIRLPTSPRKRHLFPPIEMNNKSTGFSTNFSKVPTKGDEDEPITPRQGETITAAEILAPVRSYRRHIGTPPPKMHKELKDDEKSFYTNKMNYPTIVVDEDNSRRPDESRSSKHPRSATPIPLSPIGRRKRLLPPTRLMKLNSEGTIKETEWRMAEQQLVANSNSSNQQRNKNKKNQVRLMPIQINNTTPTKIKSINTFAPD